MTTNPAEFAFPKKNEKNKTRRAASEFIDFKLFSPETQRKFKNHPGSGMPGHVSMDWLKLANNIRTPAAETLFEKYRNKCGFSFFL